MTDPSTEAQDEPEASSSARSKKVLGAEGDGMDESMGISQMAAGTK